MDGETNYLLDRLIEHMRPETILLWDLDGTRLSISAEMMKEIAERAWAAKTEEEGQQIITKFLKEVKEGKITPYD